MSRIAAIALSLLLAMPALAQSPGTLNLIGPSSTPGAPQITRVDQLNDPVNAALAAKADAANGVLTNPSLISGTNNGVAIGGTSVTGLLKGNGTAISAATPGTDYLTPTGSGAGLSGVLPLGGGTLTGPLIGTSAVFTSLGTGPINGWASVFGVRDDSPSTPVTAGTGYAVGDQLVINAGCTTGTQHNPQLVVASVTTGGVAAFNVVDKGQCTVAPTSPLAVLSTSGAGTGATFTLTFAPLSAGVTATPSVTNDTGNLFLTGTPPLYYSGTESVGVGYRPLWQVGATGSSFNVAIGHNVEGGAGCTPPTYVNQTTVIGTDALRNSCGHGSITLYGTSAMKLYNQIGTAANNFGTGNTGFGNAVLLNWNAPIANPYNTALGGSSCQGAGVGTIQFSGVTCLGARTGPALVDATNVLIVSGGGPNPATVAGVSLASGTNVLMMGTGGVVTDVPAASTSNWMNINNAIIGTMNDIPTFVSGFGTGAGFTGASTGRNSFRFGWNGGTGGAASTGVFAFPTPAPHGWDCRGRDKTTPASFTLDFAATSATQVTVTSYSRTTGVVTPWTSGDQFEISCMGF